MGRRVGLLGGTFDPPHVAHLWLAETAREQIGLDAVWFLPVGAPPHKEGRPLTAVAHRLQMVRLAIAGHPHFELRRDDMDRPPPHTTVTLLAQLRQTYPDTEFWLLIGGDSLRDLADWTQPEAIITQCRLAALPRPGATVDWAQLKAAIPGIATAVDLLAGPTCDLSATEIRRWARRGGSLRYLLPTAVIDYVNHHALYTNGKW